MRELAKSDTKNSNYFVHNVHTEQNNTNYVNQSIFTHKESACNDNPLEEVQAVSEIKMITGISKEHITPLASPKLASRRLIDRNIKPAAEPRQVRELNQLSYLISKK